jgi:hypothetical protein
MASKEHALLEFLPLNFRSMRRRYGRQHLGMRFSARGGGHISHGMRSQGLEFIGYLAKTIGKMREKFDETLGTLGFLCFFKWTFITLSWIILIWIFSWGHVYGRKKRYKW